ncbi:MAG: DUF4349 domain-containing protein [Bacteroidota bacterium]
MKHLLVSLLFLALFGCSQMDKSHASYTPERSEYVATGTLEIGESFDLEEAPRTPPPPPPPPSASNTMPEQPRLLLQRAEMRIEVKALNDKVRRLESLLQFRDGYLADLTWENNGYRQNADLDIRIPARHFQTVLDTLRQMAVQIDQQRIHTQDATEEYVDIQSRLATKKQVRDRYQDILRLKAKTVEEVLLAEEKIRVLQEEIESREGRQRYLSERAAISTINLSIYETKATAAATDDTPWYADSWRSVQDSFLFGWHLVEGVGLFLLGIWPVLLLGAWLTWRRHKIGAWWRRKFSRANA